MNLLDIDENCLKSPEEMLGVNERELIEVTQNATCALWSLSQTNANKVDMYKAGIAPLLLKLLNARRIDIGIHTMGILQNCGNLVCTLYYY